MCDAWQFHLETAMAINSEAQTTMPTEALTVTLNPAIDQTVTIPNFAAGKVNRVDQVQSDPGGKGVNVAHILADYGRRVAVTGFLGRDNAAIFEGLFTRKGIQDRFVRIAGQTRVGIKITDPARQQTTDINFPGQAPAPTDVDALFRVIDTVTDAWVVLAGSLPPAVAPTIYRDIIAMLKSHGSSVVLDTSGEALRYALEAVPRVIKPNLHELEVLLDRPLATRAAIVEAVSPLIAQGIELVVVSMGGEGACFITEHSVVVARPPRIPVKSTVGAGDAMVAGIVAGQLERVTLAACARLATAFSLDAISHIGSGLSSREVIEDLMQQVDVEEVPV
jgi:1-phosphofructokinase